MKIVVPADILERMRRHGEETYPHECCGFMLGTGGDCGHRTRKTLIVCRLTGRISPI
jgi:proteasome lid subunit RPN8/RPN11